MSKKKKRWAPRGRKTPGRTKPASARAPTAAPGRGVPIAILQRFQDTRKALWDREEEGWALRAKNDIPDTVDPRGPKGK